MKTYRGILCVVLAVGIPTAVAQTSSDLFYQAIRNNDLAKLGALIRSAGVNTKDERGSTPLMYAASVGSLDAMKLLIAHKADVNAKNAFDVTPLIFCATELAKVRLLTEKGADVNAHSKQGMTPLLVAAGSSGGSDIVKYLLDKGADIKARNGGGGNALLLAADANDTATALLLIGKGADVNATDMSGPGAGAETPLFNAAGNGNVPLMKALLAKHAEVNFVSVAESSRVKNGPIALGLLTPLHAAVTSGNAEAVKLLLDAGAKVDVQDVRGMTPLMLAIGSDRAVPATVKMLLDHGADPTTRSKAGESAIDWAKKFNQPDVLHALGINAPQAALATLLQPSADEKSLSAKQAASKGLALLQKANSSFFLTGGCVSCHAQNLTGAAIGIARANGVPVDEQAAAEQNKPVKLQWASADQILLQGIEVPGAGDTIMYSTMQYIAEGAPADRAVDAMVYNLARLQRKEGNWEFGGIARPPMEDSPFSRTALCVHALVTYEPAGRKADFDQRIARAAQWLASATPQTTEERDMQLLGLKWVKATSQDARLKELIALEHPDGGWAQTPFLQSDAYATGLTLYTLHELGVATSDPAYQRGIAFLLKTQIADGSWHVASRAPKFQPYFQSGFPHDHDQWISAAATAWATISLSYAANERPLTAQIQ